MESNNYSSELLIDLQRVPQIHSVKKQSHLEEEILCTPTAGGMGSIPAWGTRISRAARAQPKKKKRMQSIENCIIMKSVELGLPDLGKEKKIFV